MQIAQGQTLAAREIPTRPRLDRSPCCPFPPSSSSLSSAPRQQEESTQECSQLEVLNFCRGRVAGGSLLAGASQMKARSPEHKSRCTTEAHLEDVFNAHM